MESSHPLRRRDRVAFPHMTPAMWDFAPDDPFDTPQGSAGTPLRGGAQYSGWTPVSEFSRFTPASGFTEEGGRADVWFAERERRGLVTPARTPSDLMRRGPLYDPDASSSSSSSWGSTPSPLSELVDTVLCATSPYSAEGGVASRRRARASSASSAPTSTPWRGSWQEVASTLAQSPLRGQAVSSGSQQSRDMQASLHHSPGSPLSKQRASPDPDWASSPSALSSPRAAPAPRSSCLPPALRCHATSVAPVIASEAEKDSPMSSSGNVSFGREDARVRCSEGGTLGIASMPSGCSAVALAHARSGAARHGVVRQLDFGCEADVPLAGGRCGPRSSQRQGGHLRSAYPAPDSSDTQQQAFEGAPAMDERSEAAHADWEPSASLMELSPLRSAASPSTCAPDGTFSVTPESRPARSRGGCPLCGWRGIRSLGSPVHLPVASAPSAGRQASLCGEKVALQQARPMPRRRGSSPALWPAAASADRAAALGEGACVQLRLCPCRRGLRLEEAPGLEGETSPGDIDQNKLVIPRAFLRSASCEPACAPPPTPLQEGGSSMAAASTCPASVVGSVSFAIGEPTPCSPAPRSGVLLPGSGTRSKANTVLREQLSSSGIWGSDGSLGELQHHVRALRAQYLEIRHPTCKAWRGCLGGPLPQHSGWRPAWPTT